MIVDRACDALLVCSLATCPTPIPITILRKMNDFIATFIFFFAVIDPIGTVPVFIAVTGRYEDRVN